MHPDQAFAIAKAHEHETRARAREARRAAKLDQPGRGEICFGSARMEFRRRIGALRIGIAHA